MRGPWCSPNDAIGILAIDDEDRLLLVEQYRHPVRRRLLEIPAGTLDVPGESALDASIRELAEEADLVAGQLGAAAQAVRDAGLLDRVVAGLHAPRTSARCPRPIARRVRPKRRTWSSGGCRSTRRSTPCWPDGSRDSLTVAAILAAQVLRTR